MLALKSRLRSHLELDRTDGARAADIEDICHASVDAGSAHDLSDLARKVMHLAMARGLELNFSLVSHLTLLLQSGWWVQARQLFPTEPPAALAHLLTNSVVSK